ncbi:hypothetical protein [Streptomyces sp. NPDC127084]|uniref:hypothetical protein n=1 Tax=Streptomyces sp. NPDC127084 TaxID=3347133 RepID=UPI003651576D
MGAGIQREDLARAEETIRDFTDAELAVSEAQRRLEGSKRLVLERVAELRVLAAAVHDPNLVGVLRHVYWQQRGISAKSLAEAAGLSLQEMLAVIGPCPSGVPCSACGIDLLRTSRSWAPSRYGPPLCKLCETRQREVNSRERHVKELQARFIGGAPVQATAQEWQAAATIVLAYPPLSQGSEPGSEEDRKEGIWLSWENARKVRDQLISAASTENVPFDIPAASARMLIESAFKMAGWDTARTRDLLDPITAETAHALLTRLNRSLQAVVAAAQQRVTQIYPDTYEPNDQEIRSLWNDGPTWWDHLHQRT